MTQLSWHKSAEMVSDPRFLARIAAVFFGLLLIFGVAKLIWLWVDYFIAGPDETAGASLQQAAPQASAPRTNINNLVARHLFGDAAAVAQAEPDPIDAPETRLNLKLRGIYLADDANGSAIIEGENGRQAVYGPGDKLPVSGRVLVKQLHRDRVILERNGRFETLTLFEKLNSGLGAEIAPPTTAAETAPDRLIDKRKDPQIARDLSELRDHVSNQNWGSLAQKFTGQPVLEDGRMVGYRISPSKDPRLFARLGLRRNDVVTSINGVSLDDPSQLWSVQSALQGSDELQLVVQRGNSEMQILYPLASPGDRFNPGPADKLQ